MKGKQKRGVEVSAARGQIRYTEEGGTVVAVVGMMDHRDRVGACCGVGLAPERGSRMKADCGGAPLPYALEVVPTMGLCGDKRGEAARRKGGK